MIQPAFLTASRSIQAPDGQWRLLAPLRYLSVLGVQIECRLGR